jgi:enoyl-[acyl-carrier protein] reductase III
MPEHPPRGSGAHLGLEGKVALVTGATRGLGKAIATKLCASGCHVTLNYAHDADLATEAVIAMAGLAGTAMAVQADVSDPAALVKLLASVQRNHPRLDFFVHNAAAFTPMSAVEPDVDAFRREQALALNPLLYGAATLAKMMHGYGRVIAISGNGARQAVNAYVATGVAKAALEHLVRYLAIDLGPLGITVNAVTTGMLDKGPETPHREVVGHLAARTPNGRLTRPEDVADAVALLCTTEASWIQGQVLAVDGGLSIRA